jgi:hypothetical protein
MRVNRITTLLSASAFAASAQTVVIESDPPAFVVQPRVIVSPPVYAAPTIVERRAPEVAVGERRTSVVLSFGEKRQSTMRDGENLAAADSS